MGVMLGLVRRHSSLYKRLPCASQSIEWASRCRAVTNGRIFSIPSAISGQTNASRQDDCGILQAGCHRAGRLLDPLLIVLSPIAWVDVRAIRNIFSSHESIRRIRGSLVGN